MPGHHQFVSLQHHKYSKGKMLIGGSVPLLRNEVIKNPETERLLGGRGIGANKPVGIISPPPTKTQVLASSAEPVKTLFRGGELLNHLKFATKKGKNEENIKFLF